MALSILIPLPQQGFDPTEVAVPWKFLTERKVDVVFSSPQGGKAAADPIMVTGRGLKFFAGFLRADERGRAAYAELAQSGALEKTIPYAEARLEAFDGLLLPGGHAPEVREYLENELLQRQVGQFFKTQKTVAAICHGVVVAARSRLPDSEQSVLYGRKVTALTRWMELSAWAMTCAWMGSYYRTYPETVESEVKRALKHPSDFLGGPHGLRRDSIDRIDLGFVVKDRNLLTARWPGDCHRFAVEVFEALRASSASSSIART